MKQLKTEVASSIKLFKGLNKREKKKLGSTKKFHGETSTNKPWKIHTFFRLCCLLPFRGKQSFRIKLALIGLSFFISLFD